MTDINPLDIVIPILLLLYFLAGIRSGFFTTLGTFLGLGLGVCAAAWLVPLAVASGRKPVEPHHRGRCTHPLPDHRTVAGHRRRARYSAGHRHYPA